MCEIVFLYFCLCMYFLYPNFLWALSLLAVPIVIHFFNIRRYKKVYFSNTQLLKNIIQESQVKRKLKEYLILIERLLGVLFLVLAFAQPVMKNEKNTGLITQKNHEVVIYVDNSFSMENIGNQTSLFEAALNKAREIILSFSRSTKYIILTNDADIESEKIRSQQEALERLSKIKISSSSIPLSVIVKKIQSFHLSHPIVFLLSDGQKKITDIPRISADIKIPFYYFLLSPIQKNNISIDSVWLDNPVILPHQSQQLHVKLSNHHDEAIQDIPLKLVLNNVQVAIQNISIPAHQSTETTISFTPKEQAFQFGKVFINDYPVVFDDEMYFSINTNIQLKTLLVNGAENPTSTKYIRAFFQNDSMFLYSEQSENQLNFSEITQQDVVVLNEIKEYSSGLEEQIKTLGKRGKTIIIIPYIKDNTYVLPSTLKYLEGKVDTSQQEINSNILHHPFLAGAFETVEKNYKMPSVKEYINISSSTPTEPIIELNNGKLLLFRFTNNDENYYVFTSTFNAEKNKLPLHSLFVPLMYRLCFSAVPILPLYQYCGLSDNIKIPGIIFNSENPPKIISANRSSNSFQIIPIYRNYIYYSIINIPSNVLIQPGQYYLQWKDKNVFPLSFNYNRAESEMQFYSEKEIKDILNQYGLKNFKVNDMTSTPAYKVIQSEINGSAYWKLCLILALIFFIAESLTIRLMK